MIWMLAVILVFLPLGLRNNDHEEMIARTFCVEAHRRVRINVEDIKKGIRYSQ